MADRRRAGSSFAWVGVAQQLIESHPVSGRMAAREEIALSIDQTLTQDATRTMVMLALEALGLDRVRTACSAQSVDHEPLQADWLRREDGGGSR